MTVQVSEINPQTNQAVVKGSVPAKFVEMTYGSASNSNSNSFSAAPVVGDAEVFSLYVLSEDTNTGYAVFSAHWPETTPAAPLPIRDIIHSFELVRPLSN
jgi:hypothetical protein